MLTPGTVDPRTWLPDDEVVVEITERLRIDPKTTLLKGRGEKTFRVIVNGAELEAGERCAVLAKIGAL